MSPRWLLVHIDDALGAAFAESFADLDDVDVVSGDICHVDCDAIVSPANSFGFMDGGLDLALSERFGWGLQGEVQEMIAARPMGELLVGEAISVPTGDSAVPWLVVAPTMRVPMRLRQSINAFLAMKAAMIEAISLARRSSVKTVAVSGLGTGVGGMPVRVSSAQMRTAFNEVALGQIAYPRDFAEAQKRHVSLNPSEIDIWND